MARAKCEHPQQSRYRISGFWTWCIRCGSLGIVKADKVALWFQPKSTAAQILRDLKTIQSKAYMAELDAMEREE